MIAAFQLSCLMAGTYVVYDQRPLALVYVDGRFFSLSTDAYLKSDRPLPDFQHFNGPWPKQIIVKIPDDPAAQSEIRGSALLTRTPLRTLAELYIPYEFSALNTDTEAFAQDELLDLDQEFRQLPGWLAAQEGPWRTTLSSPSPPAIVMYSWAYAETPGQSSGCWTRQRRASGGWRAVLPPRNCKEIRTNPYIVHVARSEGLKL